MSASVIVPLTIWAPLTSLSGPTPAYAHVWPQHIPGTPYLLFTSWGDFRASITGEGEVPGARILDTRDGAFLTYGTRDDWHAALAARGILP